MATVRITLAAAGLLACGVAIANGTAAGAVPARESAVSPIAGVSAEKNHSAENAVASVDPESPEASPAVKPRAAKASGVSRKPAKSAPVPKAPAAVKAPASGRMQVVEPKADAPMNPARESKAWQKSHSRGLTEAQKKAFRERKENMEGMIAVIKEKRKALRDAKPEERAALARELHSLILEKDPAAATPASASASATARVAPASPENSRSTDNNGAEAGSSAKASQREEAKKAKAAEAAEYRRKRIEAYQEQQRNKD